MPKFTSLRAKLIACFLALTLLPLIASSVYGHVFTRAALSDSTLERSLNQVHLQAESIGGALRQVQGDALYLGALRSLNMLRQQTAPAASTLWRRELEQDLLVLASVRPMYGALRLLDADGREIAGVRVSDQRVNIITDLQERADAAYFRQTMALPPDGVYVSPFHGQEAGAGGVPALHYGLRLPDGVWVIDVYAGWVLRSLPERHSGDTWLLLDGAGQLLVYPEGFDGQSIAADIPAILAQGRGMVETDASVYVFESIFPAGSLPDAQRWIVLRHTPSALVYASIHQFYGLTAAFVGGAALLAVVLALAISRVLVIPVKRLERMAARFGHDGAAPPLPPDLPNDEIGALTRTFVTMAAELEGKRQQERRLIERLIHVQEEERKLVAFDLHDGLIQQLVGARFYLDTCFESASPAANEAQTRIQRGCAALTEAIVEGRRIIEGLRPAALDDLGLTAAIQEIAQTTASAAGWQLTLELERLPTEPEKSIAVTLYRIAQEALNNARKHAHAHHVCVVLRNGGGIALVVVDDGIGFDFGQISADERGLGITTMRERAHLIGGTCHIMTKRGEGTRVEVHVPAALPIVGKGGA